ncbi:hypothetical protein COCC4DRAFT_34109, partial [Bipolaris maydis ATCC 48331]
AHIQGVNLGHPRSVGDCWCCDEKIYVSSRTRYHDAMKAVNRVGSVRRPFRGPVCRAEDRRDTTTALDGWEE